MRRAGQSAFDWDRGNIGKNLEHGITDAEIEEAFSDPYRRSLGTVIVNDEERFILLGRAEHSGMYVRIVYAIRRGSGGERRIRPISARPMSSTEKTIYLGKRKGSRP